MSLKEVRQEAGLSQAQLAKKSGVNIRSIQHYEQRSKDINGAKIETLLKLCIALNCGFSDLLTDKDALRLLEIKTGASKQ